MVPFQRELCPVFPTVLGNKDYFEAQALLSRIDELLVLSGLEDEFIASFPLAQRKTAKKTKRLVQALRCTVLRMLFQLPYRKAARELGMNTSYQQFCGLVRMDAIKPPSHSALERYEKMVSGETLQRLSAHLLQGAALPIVGGLPHGLGLEAPVDLGAAYVDCTALKAHVHFPVDWLLLRDATRTLLLAIEQVRKRGVLSRMPKKPMAYLCAMNKLCIEMTHARRTKDAKKARKRIFRRMKKLMRTVEGLAQGHLEKLRQKAPSMGLGTGTIEMLAGKFTAILSQVDTIIHQAHERIIGERQVANKDKIFSLYEHDMHVIVRGKSGAEVEFGNTLFLAEQTDGLIIDWHLYKDQAPADSRMLPDHVERMKALYEETPKSVTGDRGFDGPFNTRALEGGAIDNNICPRNIVNLKERLDDEAFRAHQTRRAQTEARIAILLRNFTGNPAQKWGHENKERLCGWSVLMHNLWVLARLPRATVLALVS